MRENKSVEVTRFEYIILHTCQTKPHHSIVDRQKSKQKKVCNIVSYKVPNNFSENY